MLDNILQRKPRAYRLRAYHRGTGMRPARSWRRPQEDSLWQQSTQLRVRQLVPSAVGPATYSPRYDVLRPSPRGLPWRKQATPLHAGAPHAAEVPFLALDLRPDKGHFARGPLPTFRRQRQDDATASFRLPTNRADVESVVDTRAQFATPARIKDAWTKPLPRDRRLA